MPIPLPLRLRIHGMDCAEEVTVLKRELGPLVGGEDRLQFDILNSKMTVTSVSEALAERTIIDAISRLGMRAEPWHDNAARASRETFWFRNRYTLLTTASGLFGITGFGLHSLLGGGIQQAFGSEGMGIAHTVPIPAKIPYIASVLCGLWVVLPKAWVAAKRLRPDMNLLMTVAVVGAITVGEWFEAATVSFLFSLSLALESWSVGRARRAIESLLELAPPLARYRRPSGESVEVAPTEVPVGGIVLVSPGERLPLDGEVSQGASHVNQAPITGESEPVAKGKGDIVFAGTINGNGSLEIRVTKPAADTTLAQIIRLVGDAQSKRAPSEQWVERFAQIYTPVVMLAALSVAVAPPLVAGDWPGWIYRGLVLLVIACPCALVISTPVTIVAALAAAARQGILIKGGFHVETPARLKVFAFDKTGTLTEGKPRVMEIFPLSGHTEVELLERMVSLESHSDHPLAKAVLVYAREKGISARPAEDFQIVPGKGASGRFEGREFWLGSHRFLEEKGLETPDVHSRLTELSAAGRSVVVIGNEKHVCGFLTVADAVRPDSGKLVSELKACGIERIIMLSGDNRGTAEAVGKETGVDEVRAELLPGDKVTAIEELEKKYGPIGMVGDGVNDAPALARASLGIAMGAAGSDAAIETADIALMSDDLAKLPWLIRHSKRALSIVRQNIAFSLTVKCVFVALTFMGHASMWAAIAADMGASLLVIFNGLRLLGERARS